ncbi:copper-binding protein [Hyphomonas sp.]|uniref:copper-binding protein n=1 Tax=Hyphomonas sp. TaxID=87 RepID=UPI003D2B3CA8
MKTIKLLTGSLFTLSLAACGNAEGTAPAGSEKNEVQMEMSNGETMDHSGHDMSDEGIGHGVGIIKSLGTEGDFLTIEHGPIEGMGMNAMTMGFDTMGGVDLSAFAEGDTVAFMVKKGRDNSYRITSICNTASDGADCLNNIMDH